MRAQRSAPKQRKQAFAGAIFRGASYERLGRVAKRICIQSKKRLTPKVDYGQYGNSEQLELPSITMKQLLIFSLLAAAAFCYFRNPSLDWNVATTTPAVRSQHPVATPVPIIVPAPSSYNRWKTGPNAQTDFEPFAPNEQASWNQTPGYTIISGAQIRR